MTKKNKILNDNNYTPNIRDFYSLCWEFFLLQNLQIYVLLNNAVYQKGCFVILFTPNEMYMVFCENFSFLRENKKKATTYSCMVTNMLRVMELGLRSFFWYSRKINFFYVVNVTKFKFKFKLFFFLKFNTKIILSEVISKVTLKHNEIYTHLHKTLINSYCWFISGMTHRSSPYV